MFARGKRTGEKMTHHKACNECWFKDDCIYKDENRLEECQEIIDFEDMIKLKSGK